MERTPKPGEFYRHFKNKLYQIITVASHSETGEAMVVYQALYGTFGTYVRPLSMFISEVDHEKYPEVTQKYRFERVSPGGEDTDSPADEPEEKTSLEGNENLLAFLDAKTYQEKQQVMWERKGRISQGEMLGICEVLDIYQVDGTLEEQHRAITNYLELQSKYDGTRLR